MSAHLRTQTAHARIAHLSIPPLPPAGIETSSALESKSKPDRCAEQAALPTWQVAEIAGYIGSSADWHTHLRRRLVGRLQTLTGCVPAAETLILDAAARRATAVVDGVVFRLHRRDLVIVRPCAHCGTGCFESPPIESRTDLGYALAAWAPYHLDCELVDPPDDVSW